MLEPILLIIQSVNRIYENTICLTLKEKSNSIRSFLPGQFITIIFDIDGKEVRRGFSISSSPHQLPEIELAIKRVDDGAVSKYLFDKLAEGMELKALPPLGNFIINVLPENENHYIMIGAGSGITPLFSMLKSILHGEPKSKVTLIYGNRTEASIIYKNDLDNLSFQYRDRFNIVYYLSQPGISWDGLKGRIDRNTVDELIRSGKEVQEKSHFYLCGPEGMMEAVIDALRVHKINSSRIHREIYHTSVVEKENDVELLEREVTLILGGESYTLNIPPNKSILQVALESGLDIPNSCQYGSCGSCKAKLLSGKLKLVNQSVLTAHEIESGYCLTCVGYPASANVVILYENEF